MKVTPVIRGFCCDCSMALYLFDLFTSYVVPTRHMRWRCVVHHFRVKKVKGQGHTGRSKFWPCPLRGSIPFWPIHFICGTHTPLGDDVLRTISGSKSQGHTGLSKFLPCRSVALSLLDRFTLNVVHTQPMRWQYVAHHFWVKRSKVKVTRVDWSFCSVRSMSPSLFDLFTSYVVHTQPIRWWCVAHHFLIKRSKVKVTWVVQNFCPLMFAQWLHPFSITQVIHM